VSIGPKQGVCADFASVARAFDHAHRLELIEQLAQGKRTVEALVERLRDGRVTMLKVRPTDEFAMGHLAGAMKVPLETLEQRIVSPLPSVAEGGKARPELTLVSRGAKSTSPRWRQPQMSGAAERDGRCCWCFPALQRPARRWSTTALT